jgi:hypothetical protein
VQVAPGQAARLARRLHEGTPQPLHDVLKAVWSLQREWRDEIKIQVESFHTSDREITCLVHTLRIAPWLAFAPGGGEMPRPGDSRARGGVLYWRDVLGYYSVNGEQTTYAALVPARPHCRVSEAGREQECRLANTHTNVADHSTVVGVASACATC